MRRVLFLALGLSLVGIACDKKESAAASTSATDPGTAASATTAEAPTAADESDIPTEQDFEDEAETQITASNLETELDNLEKEIGE